MEPAMYRYRYIPSAVGFMCEIYDQGDNLLGVAPGFSKKDAKRRVKQKLGLVDSTHSNKGVRKEKKKKKSGGREHSPRGSVMTGLQGKTGARTWKYTK
jgi:hypothetical protein